MLWEMGSSRHKTQKINISGPGFFASGNHDFSKSGTNSENPIFRFTASSSFRLTEVSEVSKPQSRQSIGDPQSFPFLGQTQKTLEATKNAVVLR